MSSSLLLRGGAFLLSPKRICLLSTSSSLNAIRGDPSTPSFLPASLRNAFVGRNEPKNDPGVSLLYNIRLDFYTQGIPLANYTALIMGAGSYLDYFSFTSNDPDSLLYINPEVLPYFLGIFSLQLLTLNVVMAFTPLRIYEEEAKGLLQARIQHPLITFRTLPYSFLPKSGREHPLLPLVLNVSSNGKGGRRGSLIIMPSGFRAPSFYKILLSD
eukprot:TRINITY_DN5649_c0_g1_i1.p1 TRINITY_DN5649_c0_g1~~TRINITY_DN5649_c0_g1_i1.p1  ORF type:complete len:214 (+),score=54.68 TRINITY_DN5649_c0_g1_i1:39-680(+)